MDQNEAEFARQFMHYPYLTETKLYRRQAAYRQDNPAHARWLIVQEFTDLSEEVYSGWYELR